MAYTNFFISFDCPRYELCTYAVVLDRFWFLRNRDSGSLANLGHFEGTDYFRQRNRFQKEPIPQVEPIPLEEQIPQE